MKTPNLARLYDLLTIRERVPLLAAAAARKDDAEYAQLFNSSPRRRWLLPEHFMTDQALNVLALIYSGEQLELAGVHFFALHQIQSGSKSEVPDWLLILETSAFTVVANLEAWRGFGDEIGIDAAMLTAANHPGWFLGYCEEHMASHAPTLEELQDRWMKSQGQGLLVATSKERVASWRSLFQKMTRPAQSFRPPEAP